MPFVPVELQACVRLALRVKQANDVLSQQALVDPLTQLFNRRAIDNGLAASIAEYTINQRSFTLLLLDLDHLKAVNATYGHGVGDEVLAQVGKLIRRESRPCESWKRFANFLYRRANAYSE